MSFKGLKPIPLIKFSMNSYLRNRLNAIGDTPKKSAQNDIYIKKTNNKKDKLMNKNKFKNTNQLVLKSKLPVLTATIATLLTSYSHNSFALSAQTANAIKGTEPYMLLSDGVTKVTTLDDLLSFEMPRQDLSPGTETINVEMAGTTILLPPTMKYSDIKTLVAPDGESHDLTGAKVGDDDGDASMPENTSVKGKMKVTWYNGSTPVPASMLDQKISQCGGPYTLKIEIPEDVVVNTTYGLPNSTLYGSSPGVTYYFQPNQNNASCYSLQPADKANVL